MFGRLCGIGVLFLVGFCKAPFDWTILDEDQKLMLLALARDAGDQPIIDNDDLVTFNYISGCMM